ncbi:hypothetical protein [Limnoglobus roseus]|uniref:DUF4352 domain-containing protein n=1 Tax=Limnoglobus roseus TaxID=2598579 RepID=A0A5C1ABB9_9BACT|nr:hypothetical protein [Limnoglobus roseus]QEL16010.1 hypothetical protein PX52LOC_02948 [Limnoglobus roseus]
MPFTAVCLHCRASKFRVPFKKRGTFATCPKCAQEFMLVPDSSVDIPLMEYKAIPFDDDSDETPSPSGSEILVESAETTTTAPQSLKTTEIAIPVIPSSVPTVSGDAPDYAVRMALVGCGFVGVSMIASQFPYGRFVAGPLAVIGLLIGGLSLLGLEKRTWLGWAAVGLNTMALLLVAAFPSWLGLTGWTPASDPEKAPKPVTAVGRDGSLPKTAEWVDASQAVWEQGDVRITVMSVAVAAVDPMSKSPEKRKERVLRLTLKLSNVGVARGIEFTSWSPSPTAETKLTTTAGTSMLPRAVTADKATLYPGKSAESVLTYAAPDKFDDLRLEIPSQVFGGPEPARILIPKSLISGRSP